MKSRESCLNIILNALNNRNEENGSLVIIWRHM